MTPAIALSGGLDSLTAGFLLKKQYPGLFGIHFHTGYENKKAALSAISKQLDIEIKQIDLSSAFERDVVDYFVTAYFRGKTPNPCLVCNKKIKFGSLLDAAASFGADMIATGHYARIKQDKNGMPLLAKGKDPLKDQAYFLSMLSRHQLTKAIFPLGFLTKAEVRKIAETQHLSPVEADESQDICFVKENSLSAFLYSKTETHSAPGDIITTEGMRIGSHQGLHTFTVGQRRGINCPAERPYYVKHLDMKNNTLIVGFKETLSEKVFYADQLNWIKSGIDFPLRAFTKIRYNHTGENATVEKQGNRVKVIFDTPQYAITPGQGAVFYHEDVILGAGLIQ